MKKIRAVVMIMVLAFPSAIVAQAAPVLAKPGPEITKLATQFVGTWAYDGTIKANVFGPGGKVNGTDVYELGPGGFSIAHRWEEKNPFGQIKAHEILYYDAVRKVYASSYFWGTGEYGSQTGTWTGNTISWSGGGMTYDGKPANWRCSYVFANPTSYAQKCDASSDGGKTWVNGTFEGKWTRK